MKKIKSFEQFKSEILGGSGFYMKSLDHMPQIIDIYIIKPDEHDVYLQVVDNLMSKYRIKIMWDLSENRFWKNWMKEGDLFILIVTYEKSKYDAISFIINKMENIDNYKNTIKIAIDNNNREIDINVKVWCESLEGIWNKDKEYAKEIIDKINLDTTLLSNLRKYSPSIYEYLKSKREDSDRWKTDMSSDMGDLGF